MHAARPVRPRPSGGPPGLDSHEPRASVSQSTAALTQRSLADTFDSRGQTQSDRQTDRQSGPTPLLPFVVSLLQAFHCQRATVAQLYNKTQQIEASGVWLSATPLLMSTADAQPTGLVETSHHINERQANIDFRHNSSYSGDLTVSLTTSHCS